MRGDRRDVRTVLWAGGGFVLAGVLELLMSAGPGVAITDTVTIPYSALGFPFVPQLILLASTVLLAVRLRRIGAVAAPGWIGLVVFGAAGVLGHLLLLAGTGLPAPIAVTIGTALELIPIVGIVVAAVFIARGGVREVRAHEWRAEEGRADGGAQGGGVRERGARRASSLALVPLAVVQLITLPLLLIPSVAVVPALMLLSGTVSPALLVLAGAALLVEVPAMTSSTAAPAMPAGRR